MIKLIFLIYCKFIYNGIKTGKTPMDNRIEDPKYKQRNKYYCEHISKHWGGELSV